MITVRSGMLTDPGKKRPNNEDYITYHEPSSQDDLKKNGRIYILADGVGGASKGERASEYASQKILYDYYRYPEMDIPERLKYIIRQAGNEIYDFAQQQERFMQMATTVVVAVVIGNSLRIAHVGDSRAYLLRNNEVIQITRDHSTVGELVRDGLLTEAEAMNFEGRNVLSRSLGGERDVKVDVTEPIELKHGDRVLLCSDGFSRYANRSQVGQLIKERDPMDVCTKLVDYALQHGGVDNISVILIEVAGQGKGAPVPSGRRDKGKPGNYDSEPTLYGNQLPYRKKKNKYLVPGLIFLGVIIVVSVVILSSKIPGGGLPNPFGKENDTATPTTGLAEIMPATETPQPSETPTESPDPEIFITPTPEIEETISEPVDGPGAIEETITETTSPEGVGICRYTIDLRNVYIKCNGKDVQSDCDSLFDTKPEEDCDLFCILLCLFPELVESQNIKGGGFSIYASRIESFVGFYDGQLSPNWVKDGWIIDLPDVNYSECVLAGGFIIDEDQ